MTTCLAIRHQDRIYIFADSVVSQQDTEPVDEKTIFNQVQSRDRMAVQERMLKIAEVSNDCIVAMSGNLRDALRCLDFLSTQLRNVGPDDVMKRFAENPAWSGDVDCSLLVGVRQSVGVRLFAWGSRDPTNVMDVP